jgi:hypothetical protein
MAAKPKTYTVSYNGVVVTHKYGEKAVCLVPGTWGKGLRKEK